MKGHLALALELLCVLNFYHASSAQQCGVEEYFPGALRVNIVSRRNQTGKWMTEFHAHIDDSELDEEDEMAMDVSQEVKDCDGRKVVSIRGKLLGFSLPGDNETSKHFDAKKIRFHPKSGINTVIINNGRTVEKVVSTETAYGLAFTNRPLKDDELFEVSLEKKINYFKHSLGIGVSSFSPANMDIPKHITNIPSPTWSMYYGDLYHNARVAKKRYGKSLDTVMMGDRVGMMRRSNGVLHYFINGVDLGAAATGLPSQVYGIIEMYANAARATIVRRS